MVRSDPANDDSIGVADALSQLVCRSPPMRQLVARATAAALQPTAVLIWGEAGSGKRLLARAIHELSPRRDGPFITVSARRFAEQLFCSPFFEHVEGLGVPRRDDYPEPLLRAAGGSLLLRQISELSFARQMRLLRALTVVSGVAHRGSARATGAPLPTIRLMATTSQDLAHQITSNQFRLDAIFRLGLLTLFVPPLAERIEDLEPLSTHFVTEAARRHGRSVKRLSADAVEALARYRFPGNVRELESLMTAGVLLEATTELRTDALPAYLAAAGVTSHGIEDVHLKSATQVEREHIEHVLRDRRGNRTAAAKILGISRVSLISKIKHYRIQG